MSMADLPAPTTATSLPLTSSAASACAMAEYSMEWSTRPRNASGPLPSGNLGSFATPYLPTQRIRKSNLYVYMQQGTKIVISRIGMRHFCFPFIGLKDSCTTYVYSLHPSIASLPSHCLLIPVFSTRTDVSKSRTCLEARIREGNGGAKISFYSILNKKKILVSSVEERI
jgi:hypothetical protein